MSEHPPIDRLAYAAIIESTGLIGFEESERVENHLMYGSDHEIDGYDVFYGMCNIDPDLTEKFHADRRAHEAAILREEVTAEDLWPGSID